MLAPVGASKRFKNVEARSDAGDEVVNVWAEVEVKVVRRCLSSVRMKLLRMICGVALDCHLSDMNRVTVDLGAERASPCSSAHCETWLACFERAEAAAV